MILRQEVIDEVECVHDVVVIEVGFREMVSIPQARSVGANEDPEVLPVHETILIQIAVARISVTIPIRIEL